MIFNISVLILPLELCQKSCTIFCPLAFYRIRCCLRQWQAGWLVTAKTKTKQWQILPQKYIKSKSNNRTPLSATNWSMGRCSCGLHVPNHCSRQRTTDKPSAKVLLISPILGYGFETLTLFGLRFKVANRPEEKARRPSVSWPINACCCNNSTRYIDACEALYVALANTNKELLSGFVCPSTGNSIFFNDVNIADDD